MILFVFHIVMKHVKHALIIPPMKPINYALIAKKVII